ncbi:MAG: hypothetical protein ACM3ML_09830 [Micromonosporaceae bacterium]
MRVNAGGVVRLRLTTPAHGRYLLIWFTSLARDPAGIFRLGRHQETLMPSAGAGARGEHMATIGRHHERLTDRVSWPKRELQGTAFLSPGYAGP